MDLRRHLHEEMQKKGVRIICNTVFEKVEKSGAARVVSLSGGEKLPAEQVMLAIGRVPMTKGMGLRAAGVELNRSGHIVVDEYSKDDGGQYLGRG